MQCRICKNDRNNKLYRVREMMFGFKDIFDYFQCDKCNCLQIKQVPQNIAKYYPKSYYSFQPFATTSPFKVFFKKLRNNFIIFNKGNLGRLLTMKYPIDSFFENHLKLLKPYILHKDIKILDVGCGTGRLLYNLSISKLNNLIGIDPYIDKDIVYNDKFKILKKNLFDIRGSFDVIMFHHSFEHISNQVETIMYVSNLLANNGVCLLRVPTVSSFAWHFYKENWVQLDAPRHFYLHSIKSIHYLSDIANLKLKDIIYDSTAFQFWGSEQYKRNIPLKSCNSLSINPSNSIFSEEDIKYFSERAKKFNKYKLGDQAAFFLIKK